MIAIDGPAGAGKSTVARRVAERLGYGYVESGAMYRALALLALETGTGLDDAAALERLAAAADLRFDAGPSGSRLLLNGRDVTEAVRAAEVTEAASVVSTHAGVRKNLVERQRALGRAGGLVMEGRDIGTQVFPDADLKVFLNASAEARAERRFRDRESAGQSSTAEVLEEIAERDRRDRLREQSPLVPADDSVRIDSTELSIEEVVSRILELAERKRAAVDAAPG